MQPIGGLCQIIWKRSGKVKVRGTMGAYRVAEVGNALGGKVPSASTKRRVDAHEECLCNLLRHLPSHVQCQSKHEHSPLADVNLDDKYLVV